MISKDFNEYKTDGKFSNLKYREQEKEVQWNLH